MSVGDYVETPEGPGRVVNLVTNQATGRVSCVLVALDHLGTDKHPSTWRAYAPEILRARTA